MPLSFVQNFFVQPKFIFISEINPFAMEGLIFLQSSGTFAIM